MKSVRQEQLKYDLHNELQLRYKEFFESKMALALLNHFPLFPSVKKISAAILQLIQANENTVVNSIRNNPKIAQEISSPYFGSCYDSIDRITPENMLQTIRLILGNENADLKQVMQMHCVFIYRIYDNLEKRNEKSEWVKKLFPDFLFSKQNRSRIEIKEKEVKSTTQLGITKHPVFSSRIGQAEKKYIRAMEKFLPDYRVTFFKSAEEKRIPIVCGPSGHAGSLFLGAKLYGNLTAEELKEYAMVSFAFFAAGGHHSFHEVMIVANQIGVDFRENQYSPSIPSSIQRTDFYKTLHKQFPEFLDSISSSEKKEESSSLKLN